MTRGRGLLPAEARGGGAILGRALAVWLALVLLALGSLALAYMPLGAGNLAVAMGISAAKMLLIGLFFMRLVRAEPLRRLAAGACLLWLAFLFALTFADLMTRAPVTQPAPSGFSRPPEATTGEGAF
jgi:caa(3)-type oxidase subunit IV